MHGPSINFGKTPKAIISAFIDLIINSYDFCEARKDNLKIALKWLLSFILGKH